MKCGGRKARDVMMATRKTHPERSTDRLRIEAVDNWHAKWPRILPALKKQDSGHKLRIDKDGWLSARQVVLVALAGDRLAGHLSFSVAPVDGCVEAKVNSHGVDEAFSGR